MDVFNFDHSGYYCGTSDARPDPMTPGAFLLPAFATFDPVPLTGASERARFVQGRWVVEAVPAPEPEPHVMPAAPVQQARPESYPVTFADPADMARYTQAQLLSASDWVVLRAMERGEPVPPEWREYRQALRDVDKQDTFPADVAWPVAPGGAQ